MKIKCELIRWWDSQLEKYIEQKEPKQYYILGFYEKRELTIAIIESRETHLLTTTKIENLRILHES